MINQVIAVFKQNKRTNLNKKRDLIKYNFNSLRKILQQPLLKSYLESSKTELSFNNKNSLEKSKEILVN